VKPAREPERLCSACDAPVERVGGVVVDATPVISVSALRSDYVVAQLTRAAFLVEVPVPSATSVMRRHTCRNVVQRQAAALHRVSVDDSRNESPDFEVPGDDFGS
jgi:hypothetical protein